MWKSIKREISVNRDSLWQSELVLVGACLVGEIAAFCILHFVGEEPEFIPMGIILTTVAAVVCAVIFPAYYFSCGYEQALTLGCTRGHFLVGEIALALLHIVLLLATAGLAVLADLGFYRVFYPQVYARIDWEDFPPDTDLLIAAAAAVAALLCSGLFLGALLQRWGKRAFWVLWGVFMAFSYLTGPVIHLLERNSEDSLLGRMVGSIGRVLAFLPGTVYLCMGGAALLGAGVFGAVLLLRGSIRHAV